MPQLKKQRSILTVGAVTLLGLLLTVLMTCKNSTSPEEQNAQIYVANTCGAAIDLFADEVFKRTLDNDSDTTFTVIDEGVYILQAFKTGTEESVAYEEITVYWGNEYIWLIEGPSQINVTNNYGETLQIHINGTYLGDLDHSYGEEIDKVTFGEHTLEAKKPANGEVVDSITFEVATVGLYWWEIIKEE